MKLVPVAYLASYLLSLLGNSIAGIALPLIVLQVTGSTLGAGAVAAATAFPAVLAALVMGVVLDRINRRTQPARRAPVYRPHHGGTFTKPSEQPALPRPRSAPADQD